MGRFLRGFLDNDSVFGQIMTRCGILIAANLAFLLFSFPVITAGPAWTALHYTMLKTLREKEINPIRTFWEGFKGNFKQSLFMSVPMALLGGFLALEFFWCGQFTGIMHMFRYGVLMLMVILGILAIYLFPVTAAFFGDFKERMAMSFFFAMKNPIAMVLNLFVHVVPLTLTYLNRQYLPLFAFLWCAAGFSAVAMFTDNQLLPLFTPYLKKREDEEGDPDEQAILDEMMRLGM